MNDVKYTPLDKKSDLFIIEQKKKTEELIKEIDDKIASLTRAVQVSQAEINTLIDKKKNITFILNSFLDLDPKNKGKN